MLHDTPLIATIVGGLSLAFVLGVIARKLRISPLVGYLEVLADLEVLAAAISRRLGRFLWPFPKCFNAGQIVERAGGLSPNLRIVARAHSAIDAKHLTSLGVGRRSPRHEL